VVPMSRQDGETWVPHLLFLQVLADGIYLRGAPWLAGFLFFVLDLGNEVASFFDRKSRMFRGLEIEHFVQAANGRPGNHSAIDSVFQHMAGRGTSHAVAMNEQLDIVRSGGAERSMNS